MMQDDVAKTSWGYCKTLQNVLLNEAIEQVQKEFPHAKTLISGLIPRREIHERTKSCNDKIVEVKDFLCDMAKDTDIEFIGNLETFNKSQNENYLKKQWSNGLCLQTQGHAKLVEIIMSTINKKNTNEKGQKRSRSLGTPGSAKIPCALYNRQVVAREPYYLFFLTLLSTI